MKPIAGKRILVCGKGGSGKSTIVALIADVLQKREYETLVLDGDASNPEGLIRLLFGLGVDSEPKPLLEFFGGLDIVTCPVDDPSLLTRIDDPIPVSKKRIDIAREVPSEYSIKQNSKGNRHKWTGGKLHLSVVDGDIPITALYSSASVHDSSLALPLIKLSSQKLGQQPSVQQIY